MLDLLKLLQVSCVQVAFEIGRTFGVQVRCIVPASNLQNGTPPAVLKGFASRLGGVGTLKRGHYDMAMDRAITQPMPEEAALFVGLCKDLPCELFLQGEECGANRGMSKPTALIGICKVGLC